jgi:uncharacterized protein (DUF2384 family)
MATTKLHYVIERLSNLYTANEMQLWLHACHPMLSGARPMDLLNKGQVEEVLALITRLEHGAFV